MNKLTRQTYEVYIQKLRCLKYSENTVRSYGAVVYDFLDWLSVPPSAVTSTHINEYLKTLTFKSHSQQNISISALKFLYEKVMNKKYMKVDFRRPRPKKRQPRVVDQSRLRQIILAIPNSKHKAILALGFSCAMRVSEVRNLKITDIDSSRMMILIRDSKGGKDRYVPFSAELLDILRRYFREHRPIEYLFEGSGQYSITSMQKICRKHCQTNFHTLRHSGATAMMENGTHLNILQAILGHKKSTTTEIYLHVSKGHLGQARMAI